MFDIIIINELSLSANIWYDQYYTEKVVNMGRIDEVLSF